MPTHLFVRSSYSLLSSTIRLNSLIEHAKSLNYKAVALTDHNVMYGAASFLRQCKTAGIKPIIGLEADVDYHNVTVPFLLLAKDNKGYCDLIQLSTILCSEKRPLTIGELIQYSDNCHVIVYGEGGWFDSELINNDREAVLEHLKIMKTELNEFAVSLSYQEASLWKMRNKMLKEVCRTLYIPTCALNKVYYLRENEVSDLRVLTGIREGKTIMDQNLPLLKGRHFLDQKEFAAIYDADDLAYTDQIADDCNVNGYTVRTSLPEFNVPDQLSSSQYLTQLCLAGLKKRMADQIPQEYLKRLKYELDIIIKMHFEDYFLIVWDFIRYARTQKIMVGPGRGSAAGSLVSYCLGITQIDPIRYDLLFERFLNPDRISMPDIDTDIPDNRRQEVIEYVAGKYGIGHVANIITFGTLGARQVIRDTGKVLNMNQNDISIILKLIPSTPKITLSQAMEQNRRLKDIVKAEEKYGKLFTIAMHLEGLPRHASTHAAGIVLSSLKLTEVVPLLNFGEGLMTTQYSMEYLEELGLIKMDFLGLRNLTIISQILEKVKETYPAFTLNQIPLDDKKTYEVFQRSDTVGVFQFESSGMKSLLNRLQVKDFADIVAALALFRPASKDSIPSYIYNRQNPDSIVYLSDELEPVLKDTYGVMIYQEQAMQTAQIAAGFSLAKADILRKAMSKKKEVEIARLSADFINGAKKNGYDESKANLLFETVKRFGGYGFNKSHAVAYGLVAYQMAYLKANFPLYFYTALLNSVIGDSEKTAQYIDECRRRNIRVDYPNVMTSSQEYRIRDNSILLPLTVIKGVGVHLVEKILEIREKENFIDFFDFVARLSLIKINRTVIETMINAGALDCFGETRTTMKGALDDALSYGDLIKVEQKGIFILNYSLLSRPTLMKRADLPEERSLLEREALGFTVGNHPIIEIRKKLGITTEALSFIKERTGYVDGFAEIVSIHVHRTKRGDMMCFLKLADETSEFELTVMPKQYQASVMFIRKGTYVLFRGRIANDKSAIAETLKEVKIPHK